MLKRLNAVFRRISNWPWIGLLLSALFVLAVFQLPKASLVNQHDNTKCRATEQQKCPLKLSGVQIHQPNATHPIGGNNKEKSPQRPSAWSALKEWLSIGNNWLIVATMALAMSAFAQVDITRRSFKRQLRAYIQTEGGTLQDMATVGKPPNPFLGGWIGCVTEIKNTGQTPAHEVLHWCDIAIIPIGEEYKLVIPDPLGPGAISTIGRDVKTTAIRYMSRQVTLDELSAIRMRTSAIFVFGRVIYRDIFGRTRTTNYRFHFFGDYPPPPNVILNFSPDGNDSD